MSDLIYKLDKTSQDIDNLLSEHKNLVYHMLTCMQQLDNPDAESAAWEGLWNAINTYDVFSAVQFSTYACKVIRNAINDELRKCYIKRNLLDNSIELCSYPEPSVVVDFDADEAVRTIYKLFDEYVVQKVGINKNILLAWYSSNFESNPTNLATICHCSTSYVCRVQGAFRAYIITKLKEH